MKITKMNNGFFKLGSDEYRVEAPMKYPNETKLEDFTLPDGRAAQRYVTIKTGKKLRSSAGCEDEVEPKVWNIYKMNHFKENGEDKVNLETIESFFTGTAKQAIAICEAHKAGG